MHTTVWGLALLAALLPLCTGRYGRESSERNSFCFVGKDADEWYIFWNVVDWILYLFTCIAMMVVFFARIYYKYKVDGGFQSNVFSVLSALYVYPFVLLITWVPNVVFINIIAETPGISDAARDGVLGVSQIIGMSNRFFLAVVFFLKSPEGRKRWKVLCCMAANNGNVEEDEITRIEKSVSNVSLRSASSVSNPSNHQIHLVTAGVLPAGREDKSEDL
jgi:hypothetical protein